MTAPTCLRSQVAREETSFAMFMKYSSQDARAFAIATALPPPRARWQGKAPNTFPSPRCCLRVILVLMARGLRMLMGWVMATSLLSITLSPAFAQRPKSTAGGTAQPAIDVETAEQLY